jgi:hypothetical protein
MISEQKHYYFCFIASCWILCSILPTVVAQNTTTVAPASPSTNVVVNISELPTCPFSRWQGEPRYCYECRWCPFRSYTCCEMEDEYDVLKSINVSGSDNWDCFITIAHFQQCGRCSPSAKSYLMQADLNALHLDYVWEWRNLTIRPCKQACEYIYKQCSGAKLLNGKPVVPDDVDVNRFCAPFPEFSTPGTPCYNASGPQGVLHWAVGLLFAVVTIVASRMS